MGRRLMMIGLAPPRRIDRGKIKVGRDVLGRPTDVNVRILQPRETIYTDGWK